MKDDATYDKRGVHHGTREGGTNSIALSLRSPMRFPGGKSRVAAALLSYIPPHERYREPFAGGAGIFFRKPKARHSWLNDAHSGIYAFYVTVRDRIDDFIAVCRDQPRDLRKTFKYWTDRTDLMEIAGDEELLDRAVQFYFINRTVWGGRVIYDPTRKSRLYFSNPQGWSNLEKKIDHLKEVSRKLMGVKITCRDFDATLTDATRDTFIYCDPPYIRDSVCPNADRLYDGPFTMEYHRRLAEELSQSKALVMVSYDDCEEARRLYRPPHWRRIELQWKYSGTYAKTREQKVGRIKETKVNGKELLILNYDPRLETVQ